MKSIKFNHQTLNIENEITLAELLKAQGYTETHFAVAINQEFLPRAQYETTHLNENDSIEIVLPMQGG